MKLHLSSGAKTACGRRLTLTTEDRGSVTCKSCTRTRVYRQVAPPNPNAVSELRVESSAQAPYRLAKPDLANFAPADPVRTPQPETDPAAIAADRAAYWHALYRSAVSETEKLRVEMAEMQRAVRVEAIVGQRGRMFPGLWR